VPTLAPVLTAASGLTPDAVGYLAAAGTAGSILFLAAGNPIIARLGPIRALQVGLGVGIGGVLLLVVPSALVQFGSSFLAGLAYGPSAPAGSDILLRLSPAHRRTLIFSLKQAGVPLSHGSADADGGTFALAQASRLTTAQRRSTRFDLQVRKRPARTGQKYAQPRSLCFEFAWVNTYNKSAISQNIIEYK
jgi:hypothetical protein